MGFPERRRALVDAAFATFGEAAEWEGAGSVCIRLKKAVEEQRFGGMRLTDASTVIRVRSWEVLAPASGQAVVIVEGVNAGRLTIVGNPLLDDKGVWSCRFEADPA